MRNEHDDQPALKALIDTAASDIDDEITDDEQPDDDADAIDADAEGIDADAADDFQQIGQPFAMANDCEILQGQIVIRCGKCQQVFRFNPIDGAIKTCPTCGARFSHVLLIGLDDDEGLWPEACDHVAFVNNEAHEK